MNSKKAVLQQTGTVAAGQAIGVAAMLGIFALAGHFDLTVLLGGLAGGLVATANFFLLCLFADIAADKAQAQDVAGGQKLIHLSYSGRLLGLFLILVLLAKSGYCHPLALVIPLVFTRPALALAGHLKKKGSEQA